MSGMNYVDDGFVFEDVYKMARERRGAKVIINWVPATSEELFGLPARVRKCVMSYRYGLQEHLKRHRIDATALLEFRTEVYVAENFRMYVRSYVLDDKNKEHVVFVYS
jgi:ABC-type Mn2+/Zn2+ transport system ATPase subunit